MSARMLPTECRNVCQPTPAIPSFANAGLIIRVSTAPRSRGFLPLFAWSATVLRPAFLPPNQECSTDSSGLPDPLPPSDDLDWGQLCFACDFLLRSSIPPAHPVFPSTFPGLPRVLLSHLAAPDLALSSASRLAHSAAKTCYASSRSISFSCDCTLSALITASLTPSVIGDRPSHPIYRDLSPSAVLLAAHYLGTSIAI